MVETWWKWGICIIDEQTKNLQQEREVVRLMWTKLSELHFEESLPKEVDEECKFPSVTVMIQTGSYGLYKIYCP